MSETKSVTEQRIVELIAKAIEYSFRDDIPPDALLTREAIGATEEEFRIVLKRIDDLPF